MMRPPRLHLVTDDDVLATAGFVELAEAVLAGCGPAATLHLRGHTTPVAQRHALGERLAAAALRTGSWLLVNDRVDIAMALRANGVQLGAASLPVSAARALLGAGARIGYSAHSALEVMQAETDGADFALAGTIFPSASHPDRAAAGLRLLSECVARSALPVVAIGGITPERVAGAAQAGAYGVAVLGGVWHATDPVAAAARYVAALRDISPEPVIEEQVT
jgi:thiamine-phosphate diphosphorylase